MKKNINFKYLNILLILGIVYLLFLMRSLWLGAFFKILGIILPFIIAFLVAYVLYPFLKYLTKKRIPKMLAVFIIIIVILLVFGLTLYYVVPLFFNQLINLLSNLEKISSDLTAKLGVNTNVINDMLKEFSNRLIKDASTFISNGAFVGVLVKSVDFISKFIIVFMASVYFLVDMEKIRYKIKNFLIKTNRKKYVLISNIDKEITSYLKGIGILMIIQFFEYTSVFLIIGHPNFLLIGTLACITTVIPYFGGIITNVIALIIASVISPKLFILTLIVTLIFPNIDGYIISPKIYGRTNRVPPLLTIFAVFAGGALFGFIGIVLALPFTIVIMSIIKSYKSEISVKIKKVKEKM